MADFAENTEVTLSPRREEIERFLREAIGDSIQLNAISQEGGPPQVKWFGEDSAEAAGWATKMNAQRHNVYFTVNVVTPHLIKKATKSDIVSIRYAHVDIDPPSEGSEWDKDEAILQLELLEPEPSIIIDSGGGLQAFWRLDGTSDGLEVEALNKAIERQLGGDHCHNVDRIMRVPGTVNYPNEKKRRKGRIPAPARLLYSRPDSYPVVQLADRFKSSSSQPDRGMGSLRAAEQLNAVGIVQGSRAYRLMLEPDGVDRSKDTFAVACEMVRLRLDDAAMIAILLNPELPISAHCLMQSDPERAARRAIEGARGSVRILPQNSPLCATPYRWPEPTSLPTRQWLFGHWLLKGEVTAIIAPGGTGKSTISNTIALSLASGRSLLGKSLPRGPQAVWVFNLEDGTDELERQLAAACAYHDISRDECGNRLFLDSGLIQPLCTAIENRDGFELIEPVFAQLAATICDRQITVIVVDPFVSSHAVRENGNEAVDAIIKRWKKLAQETGCAVVLVHHTKKLGGREATAEDGGGAVALRDAARAVLALNPMSEKDAEALGIGDTKMRRSLVRIDTGKSNRAPPDVATWIKLETQCLGNGLDGEPTDDVGVATLWEKPDLFHGITISHLYDLQQRLDEKDWRKSIQAKDWVNHLVAQIAGLSADTAKGRINAILRTWYESGSLAIEYRHINGKDVPCVVAGELAEPSDHSPHFQRLGAESAEGAGKTRAEPLRTTRTSL